MKPSPIAAMLLLAGLALGPGPTRAAAPTRPPLPPVVGRNAHHVVRRGETLFTIGQDYRLAIDHLMWANGLSTISTPVGKKLLIPSQRVVPGDLKDGLIINLPERGMYLFKNHRVVAFYPCAIGRGGRFATPTGDARIIDKEKNPVWDAPRWANLKEPVPAGPDNPLGDRWIGLSIPGVGLHGTTSPLSVGDNASHGCMRMYPSVVRILFDQVKVGMPVRIVYQPIKLGLSDDRQVWVQVFPDVYGRVAHPLDTLKGMVEKVGLGGLVDDDRLQALLAAHDGVAQSLLGDRVVIKVNDQPVTTALAPFLRNGQIWATSDLLDAIGAHVRFNPEDRKLVVTRNAQEVDFQIGDGDARDDAEPDYAPRLWNGRSVLPLKPILRSLELDYKWVPRYKTLLIYCAGA